MKYLVTYDGTLQSRDVLKYGLEKVRENGGELIALYVFNTGMFIGYDSHPGAEEIARRESLRYVEEAKALIQEAGGGLHASIAVEDGDPAEETLEYARGKKVDMILTTPRYKSLVRKAPCPVSIIPGNILVPVDNTESLAGILARVAREAKMTGSTVVLLGIVPVHIYSKWEKDEMEKVEKETALMIEKGRKRLKDEGIEVKGIMARGYPDEEITKAAEELAVSMIMIPDGGDVPSELSKAANIILDEPERMRKPVFIIPLPPA